MTVSAAQASRSESGEAQFGEAGSREVAVEREDALNAEVAAEREARRIDERVLTFAVPTQPAQRLRLERGRDRFDPEQG